MLQKKLPEDEIQKLIEYRKKYYGMRKKCLFIIIRNISFKNNEEYKDVLKNQF